MKQFYLTQKNEKMKKMLFLAASMMVTTIAFTQDEKTQIKERIEDNLNWLNSIGFEHMVNLNLSPTLWTALLDKTSARQGYEMLSRLGKSTLDCSDYLYDTRYDSKYSYNPSEAAKKECVEEVIANKSKINVTINASNIKFTDLSYRLLSLYIAYVDCFIGSGSCQKGFTTGWRPKSNEMQIVVDMSEKGKEITVKWSADGKKATITAPAFYEVAELDLIIMRGLEKGGSKTK
jgi:hypothetical protein